MLGVPVVPELSLRVVWVTFDVGQHLRETVSRADRHAAGEEHGGNSEGDDANHDDDQQDRERSRGVMWARSNG